MNTRDVSWETIFRDCPGAWFGNRPQGALRGHITVDPTYLNEAITYLAGFVGTIRLAGTRPSPREGIQIRLRDAAYLRAQARAARQAHSETMRSLGMVRTRSGGWE